MNNKHTVELNADEKDYLKKKHTGSSDEHVGGTCSKTAKNEQKEIALQHVRGVCPELMELSAGCTVSTKYNTTVRWTAYKIGTKFIYCQETPNSRMPKQNVIIIGHTPHLEHWLRGIVEDTLSADMTTGGTIAIITVRGINVTFNLTTGQPATEADYKAYNEIVGVA